jgi:F-type H+-transporting ATPase subunit a
MITAVAAATPHVSLAAEEVFSLFGFPITNSMILGTFGYGIVVGLLIWVARSVSRGSQNRAVLAVQWMFEGLYGTVEQVMGDREKARRLAPLAITLFFFIITNYWLGILPFVGPITYNGVPLFRGLAADLNVTFALAIITMVTAQIYAIRVHGAFGHLGRYLRNPLKDPAGAFEGVLELIAEFSRLVALSLRLFGNVFAGEVLLIMVGFLTVWFSPIVLPFFMIFELFIGFIQAYVFFMLTVVFISLGTVSHQGHDTQHA